MRECVTYKTNLTQQILVQKPSLHFLTHTCMTHLRRKLHLILWLGSEYWHCKIQTLVFPLNHRNSFFLFFAYRKLTFILYEGIYHPLSYVHAMYLLRFIWIGINFTGRVEVILLDILHKFHYQNQQHK